MPSKFFFAIMTPQEVENDLLRLQSRVQHGTLVPKRNLHVTLAFIGSPKSGMFSREALTEVGNDLATLATPAHSVAFTQVEYWARAKCLVLTPGEAFSSVLGLLHKDLYSMLGKHGFSKATDYPTFRPHITLAKPLTKAPAQAITKVSPVTVRVRNFALVESTGGGTYNTVKTWELVNA